jgi:hypothetical protein
MNKQITKTSTEKNSVHACPNFCENLYKYYARETKFATYVLDPWKLAPDPSLELRVPYLQYGT